MSERSFHLTIGPVQAFVAQARRTRDFWAGSFILSFLSSVAMSAVRRQKGEIRFPVPDDNYLNWLEGSGSGGSKPLQGSVPNRFKAMEVRVAPDFEPSAVVDAIHNAWKALAELVWDADLAPVAGDDPVHREIWERQINRFWDVSWCLTDDPNVSNLLDRRKNWRSHILADEPGVKCSLMEGFQELSGAERPGESVRRFWARVREQDVSLARDCREDEHLCAIAFVKRRFAHYFDQFQLELPPVAGQPDKYVQGWQVPKSVPSVAYLAAVPWLAASIRASGSDEQILPAILKLQQNLSELDVPWEGKVLRCVEQACSQVGRDGWRWSQVNGQYLFRPAVQQLIKETEKAGALLTDDLQSLKQIPDRLSDLKKLGLGEPSPFYAVLLMDGDSLGAQMSDSQKQAGISQALNTFNRSVPGIVENYSGFLVYAGGDDVLALLPQPDAIACARALQQCYAECFDKQNEGREASIITTSLSGAIEFAHYKSPLTRILEDAHQLLDDVAKDQTGRDSLAIRVWKPGGLVAQWSAPWSCADDLCKAAEQVATHLKGDLSRSFFFKLDGLIEQLGLAGSHEFEEQTIQSLVRAAWTHTGNKLDTLPENMDRTLLEACRVVTREMNSQQQAEILRSNRFSSGALGLLQFLATENRAFTLSQTDSGDGGSAA